jgi:hypothetical protein
MSPPRLGKPVSLPARNSLKGVGAANACVAVNACMQLHSPAAPLPPLYTKRKVPSSSAEAANTLRPAARAQNPRVAAGCFWGRARNEALCRAFCPAATPAAAARLLTCARIDVVLPRERQCHRLCMLGRSFPSAAISFMTREHSAATPLIGTPNVLGYSFTLTQGEELSHD